jgi:SRSO17 transposase
MVTKTSIYKGLFMGLDNYINYALKSLLKNPILEVLQEIKITKILKQSNFVKRDIGHSSFQILLHFIYMLVLQKRQSNFIKQSDSAFSKDTYYRFIKESRYNWRKLLLLSTTTLLQKIKPLYRYSEHRLLIIDDTIEPKRGKYIEGSCKSIYSNKEQKSINGINIVSLNYTDTHSTFQLDFSIKMNDSKRLDISEFTTKLHHLSNAYKRRSEIIKGKNTLAIEMLERALDCGVEADYLLVDSWYAKPNFIKQSNDLGMPVVARVPNNNFIWNFKGKHKTLNSIYNSLKNVRKKQVGKYGKISYEFFGVIVEHDTLGKVKLVFLHTRKDLLAFISTDLQLSAKEVLKTYKKRWNIEQGYKELREYFGLGKEENRIYEALIAKITLSMFAYNIVSYINRIRHEPQTLGKLFRDLECELESLVISMQLFIKILTKISEIQNVVKENKNLLEIIDIISAYTQKELGFMCES